MRGELGVFTVVVDLPGLVGEGGDHAEERKAGERDGDGGIGLADVGELRPVHAVRGRVAQQERSCSDEHDQAEAQGEPPCDGGRKSTHEAVHDRS